MDGRNKKPNKAFKKVTAGSITVPIYRIKVGKYQAFEVRGHELGGVKRVVRANLKAALNEADLMIARISAGQAAQQQGITPEIQRIVDEWKELSAKAPLREAVAFYLRHHWESDVTVNALVDKFLQSRKDAKSSDSYLNELKCRLGKWKADMGTNRVCSITAKQIMEWILSRKEEQNKGKLVTLVKSALNWAKRTELIPHDWAEADKLYAPESNEKVEAKVSLLTAADLVKVLAAVPENSKAFTLLAAFSGGRVAELMRLTWADVMFDRGVIQVGARNAKTAQRRLMPLLPGMQEQLKPLAGGPNDRVAGFSRWYNVIQQHIHPIMGGGWPENALRHSYISYRLAILKDVAAVALECGTSAAKIFSNYRELVTEADAQAYFSVINES